MSAPILARCVNVRTMEAPMVATCPRAVVIPTTPVEVFPVNKYPALTRRTSGGEIVFCTMPYVPPDRMRYNATYELPFGSDKICWRGREGAERPAGTWP